ncbi:endonuclease/exonuclease/phosphatase family metal-dependent hydrolase [Kitasatospora sp. MAP12-15]|uniref:endonuclease/exonuclease/phosphatase family protein n=1 Tax=unclassified Kitasatospora TaxID=2633591 RepID=UPI0024747924|nr:endonuclease/exonuclease/phosphatase family protein [Kitasatospora sp. MAP12-44]MDH6111437.1 endonuclease/exonuclease/phosphatase family metal-dependent hydrolase [Kitasatospora sp. MAP12-44]
MKLTIVVQNLGRGGIWTGSGEYHDRWPQLVERIAPYRPDLLLVQECEDWEKDGHKQLIRAERDLDMDGLLPPCRSGRGPALLYRRSTLGRRSAWKFENNADEVHHGFGVAAFDLPGLPMPLGVASVHVTPWGSDKAVVEAQYIASRAYKYGPYCIAGGDINYSPAEPWPEPQYSNQKPYNRGARTLLTGPDAAGRPMADRRVAQKFAQNGFKDAARLVFDRTQDQRVLAKTGTDDRIDQLWVSSPIAPAVVSYELLDTPDGASDHYGFAVVIDTELIDTADPWSYT